MTTLFANLPEATQKRLLTASATLLTEVVAAWGPDEGLIVWQAIAASLNKDLADEFFVSILKGENYRNVVVTHIPQAMMVSFIKAVRTHCGYGLKEAKDLYDIYKDFRSVSIPMDYYLRQSLVIELLSIGCEAV